MLDSHLPSPILRKDICIFFLKKEKLSRDPGTGSARGDTAISALQAVPRPPSPDRVALCGKRKGGMKLGRRKTDNLQIYQLFTMQSPHWAPVGTDAESSGYGSSGYTRSVGFNRRKQMANQSGRGFAGMDDDKQRDIASKGGQSVPAEKRSFSQDHELASEAGKKGGEHSHGGQQQASTSDRAQQSGGHGQGGERGGSGNFANDRGKAAEAGRKGGQR
jgi:general stress protein YciG